MRINPWVCVAFAAGLGAVGWLWLGSQADAKSERDREQVRAAMQGIYSGMQAVLPLTVSDDEFRNPVNAPEIRASLEKVANGAALLGEHIGEHRGRGFRFLGDSLSETARGTLRAFDMGRYDLAEYRVYQMTEYCVACHSRLPSGGDSPLAEDFIETSDLKVMPLQERAALQVATRRFEAALESFELLFRSPEEHPAALLDPLVDYVTLAVRVTEKPERAIPALQEFSERGDLWEYLRLDVEHWVRDLKRLVKEPTPPATFEAAQERIDRAKRSIQFPGDRRALVDYVVASSILHRFLDSEPDDPRLEAQAYYLLGVTETRIGRSYWISQANFYLETAIRLGPGEPFAREAYALLEEETVLGYTGSGGTHLPAPVEARLAELRALSQGGPTTADP